VDLNLRVDSKFILVLLVRVCQRRSLALEDAAARRFDLVNEISHIEVKKE